MNIIKKERLIALGAVFAVLLAVYIVSLYKLQIIEGEAYYKENRNNMVSMETVQAARGNILDRYGRTLVTNKTSYDLTINTNELFPNDDSVDSNETILTLVNMIREYGNEYNDELPITKAPPFEYTDMSSIDEARLDAYKERRGLDKNASAVEVLSDMRVRYEIDGNYNAEDARIIAGIRYAVNVRYLINTSEYIFVQDADMKLISTIRENNVQGVSIKESFVREYATEAAAHLLGYVNSMNDEQYDKYKELGYTADTKVGQSGAEAAFEKYLHGTNGTAKITAAPDGTVIGTEYTVEPQPGNNVYLTIDIALQEAAERALENGVADISAKLGSYVADPNSEDNEENNGTEITGAAVVAVDVKTGEPLAMASWPSYNPSELLEKYQEISTSRNAPLFNRTLYGQYAPGSTFKPCTAIAALTEGLVNTNTTIECKGRFTRYIEQGYAPYCWIYSQTKAGHGYDNIIEALRDSCNVFFCSVGHDLGISKMEKYAALLGLGEPTGIELSESTGNMSNPDNHFDLVGEEWTIGDTMQAAIGQSDSIFTPLQLAEYCAAVANGGVRHSASVLKSVRSYDYSDSIYERETEVLSKVESPDYNWDAVHQGMYLVANDWSGSGHSVFLNYTASSVACKTGTAQKGETVTNDGIFICYAPYEDPEIAVAVVVQRGGSGTNCGPIAREVLEAYFALKDFNGVFETEWTLLK